MAAGRNEVDLGPFTSSLAARWVAEDPDRTHLRREGSLVSADLSGFTALSERLAERGKRGAEDLTAMVNACFTALIRAAAADGGDVLKFGGDALLVWFEGDDHAVRAVRAAARMQRAIGAARFRRAALSMSVGAHTGTFDHFLVGQPEWRELVVVGRPVSTTVELEAAATAGEVLISPALAAAVPDECLGEWRVDGVLVAVDDVAGVGARLRPRARESIDVAAAARLVAPSLQSHVAALAGTSGEHRLATVVFAELEGTDESVAGGAEAFARSVDDLVRSVEGLADRYGLLFLYTDVIADGLKFIVVAGAPTSTGEDEEAGLRFATDLVAGDPKHKLRVGVNRGRVFAGFLGSEERRTYTVMGDPVNLSARLMARAEPGQVLGSDEVVRASRAEFSTTPVAPFLVKGKAKPVTARLVGSATGLHRSREAGAIPLVGRDLELVQLRGAIGAAVAGEGQVVEIVGDAGIGKTRLIQAVGDDARMVVRIATECQPYDALSPFAGVRPLLRRALGCAVDASPAQAGASLDGVVRRIAPELLPLLPLIAVPLGAEVGQTPEAAAVADEFRQSRMHELVVELLGFALPTPSLLVIEDIYYVDDASLQLLRAIAKSVPGRPWAMLITRRPEGPGLVVGEVGDGLLLKIEPLGTEITARLAEAADRDGLISAADVRMLTERSGGNPLFVLELIEAARTGVAADDLPESIERLVASRIDRLDPDDRARLRHAAVVGRVFHVGLVNTLFATEGRALVTAPGWARLSEFVEPEGDRSWRFRHALFRDVAYEGLPFARRKRLHQGVGELLEAGVAGEPDVALLSQHFSLASDAPRSWRYSLAAGQEAWASLAIRESVEAYRRALQSSRRVPGLDPVDVLLAWERLADGLERTARYDEAARALDRARTSGSRSGDEASHARLLRKRGVIAERQGQFVRARRWYERASRAVAGGARAGAALQEESAEVEIALAGIRHRMGDQEAMIEHARRAFADASSAGRLRTQAYAANQLQVAVSHGGVVAEHERDTHFGQIALALLAEVSDVRLEGMVLLNIGIEAYYRGRWSEALDRYAAAGARLETAGDVLYSALARNNRAEVLSDQGHLDEADEVLGSVERAWLVAGYGMGVAVARSNRGRALGRLGRFAEADAALDDAEERFRALGSPDFLIETIGRRAEVSVYAGDVEQAAAHLGRLPDDVDSHAHDATRCMLLRVQGWISAQQGDLDSAITAFRALERRANEANVPFEAALALDALDRLGAPAGASDLALQRLGIERLPLIPLA